MKGVLSHMASAAGQLSSQASPATPETLAREAWQVRSEVPRAAVSLASEVLAGAPAPATRGVALAALAVARLANDEPAAALEAALQVPDLVGEEELAFADIGLVLTEARLTALRSAHLLDDVAGAVRWGRESLALAQKYELPLLVARGHNDLAAVYGSREVIDVAIKHLNSGIAALEAAGLPVAPSLLTNLGNVYMGTGRLDEALACFGLGRQAYTDQQDRFGAALARSNEGRAHLQLGSHAEAVTAQEEALAWFEEIENARYVTVTRTKLAQAYEAAGDIEHAADLYEVALADMSEHHDAFEAEIRGSYGTFLLRRGQHEAALAEMRFAAKLFDAAMKPIPAANLRPPIGEALAALGRHEEAYLELKAYQAERERTDTDRTSQVLSMLLAQLESSLADEHELHVVARQAVADANRVLREQAERLEALSITDDLTGLFNRRYFRTRLDEEEARARRHANDLVVVLLDVDNFKRVNDSYSHTVGDAVLVRVGELLRHVVRGSDVVARWGGEEFVVLVPGTSKAAALEAAERARLRVASYDWNSVAAGLEVTVSVGVAALSEVEGVDVGGGVAELVRLVDARLYAAKRAGRNRTNS